MGWDRTGIVWDKGIKDRLAGLLAPTYNSKTGLHFFFIFGHTTKADEQTTKLSWNFEWHEPAIQAILAILDPAALHCLSLISLALLSS